MFDFLRKRSRTEHELCHEDLSTFLDGRLTPRERSRVEGHLAQCAACRADLEALRHTVALLRTMPVVKPPRSFLMPAGEVTWQRPAQRLRLAYGFVRAATAVAAVLLVLVVSGDALLRYQLMKPAPSISLTGPASRPMLAEEAAPQGDEGVYVPTAAAQPSPEVPYAMGPAAPSGGGQTTELSVAAEQSPESPTSEAFVEPLVVSEVGQTETTQPELDKQLGEPRVKPSQTFAKLAAPPAPLAPTSEEKPSSPAPVDAGQPSPTLETMAAAAPTRTPLPAPSDTPIPPTPTPVTVPTGVTVLPAATASPRPAAAEEVDRGRFPPSGAGLFLEALRPLLPGIELALAVAVAFLLALTLWLRRRERPV
jgi:hypothetical protein